MRPVLLLVALVSARAAAEPPPHQKELSQWASASGYALSAFTNCKTEEEKFFGSMGSVCWTAKSAPRAKGAAARLRIILSVYRTEAEATARMTRFREVPKVQGEVEKTWPLRAGFRVGQRVLTVTTDAVAFEKDAYAAAAALAKALKGSELTCWAGEYPGG